MSGDLLQAIKAAAVDAVNASKPANVLFGIVTKESPLEITVEQKMVLTEAFLILSRNVTDFYLDMTVDHLTEKAAGGGGHASYASHNHGYVGRKTFLVHKKLTEGEAVILIACPGGQKFVVWDRIGVK